MVGKFHRCSGPGENWESFFSEREILCWERVGKKLQAAYPTPEGGSAAVGGLALAREGKASPDHGEER